MAAFLLDLRIAFWNLVEHRRRTFLLGAAVAAVSLLFVLSSGLSDGVRRTLVQRATTVSAGHLNVGGFYKVTFGQAGSALTDYAAVRRVVERALPELDYSVNRGRGWGKLVSDTGSLQASIVGVDIAEETALRSVLRIESGRIEELAQPNSILLFRSQADKLGLRVGDALTISADTIRGVANTIDCRVVAIADDMGMLSLWNAFIPNDTQRALYQLRSDVTGAIQIYVRPEFLPHLGALAGRLRAALEAAGYRVMGADPSDYWVKLDTVAREDWTGQKLDVTTWQDELSYMTWSLGVLDALSWLLMSILMLIIVAGVMNTIWIAIRERTREIGTLRAIGMQRGSVVRMFVFESFLLGALGATLGALLGPVCAAVLNAAKIAVPPSAQVFLMSDTLELYVLPSKLLAAVALVSSVTSAAALYPALRAARLAPVNAMSHFA